MFVFIKLLLKELCYACLAFTPIPATSLKYVRNYFTCFLQNESFRKVYAVTEILNRHDHGVLRGPDIVQHLQVRNSIAAEQ